MKTKKKLLASIRSVSLIKLFKTKEGYQIEYYEYSFRLERLYKKPVITRFNWLCEALYSFENFRNFRRMKNEKAASI